MLPVLLVFGLLRFDIARIEGDVAAASRANDCRRVTAAMDRVTLAHRMVAVAPAADGDETVKACTLVPNLLKAPRSGLPAYCSAPVPYAAAPSGGPNRALIVGDKTYVNKIPAEWRADDVFNATRVLCVGERQPGVLVQTCKYTGFRLLTFHRVVLPVRVYEVRTARLVTDTRVEIGDIGDISCPSSIHSDDETTRYVSPPDSQIQAAFRPLISP